MNNPLRQRPGLAGPLPALLLAIILAVSLALPGGAAIAADSDTGGGSAPLKPEQLDQLLAPIALYPDSLLAQVLMASTYPLEVVSAARWVQANPNLTGQALDDALQKETWDPSVKSLVTVPQTLQMMNDKLDWTQQLGDAFLSQQKDVMDSVQRLRAKAQSQGSLTSTKQQTVKVEDPGSPNQVIVIESAQPDVIYVPSYNPTVVYGAWPYPSYPPVSWYPPGYVASNILSFGVGMAVGYAMWGDCDWHGGDVDINYNYYQNFNHRSPPSDWHNGAWQHDPVHRKGVPYNNANLDRRFSGKNNGFNRNQERAKARDAFRGHAGSPAGRLSPASGGHGQTFAPNREHRLANQNRHAQTNASRFKNRSGQGAFQGMERGQHRVSQERLRGGNSRQIMRSHPSGGGFHGGGFHGGGRLRRR